MESTAFDATVERDEDLLTWMSWAKDMPENANAAFGEFHRRHVKYLFNVCRNLFGEDLEAADIEDLVQQTFWTAYQKASTFTPSGAEPEAARRRILGWLGQIANRLFLTAKRKQSRQIRMVLDDCETVSSTPAQSVVVKVLEGSAELVRRALDEALTSAERQVLLEFARYYDPENPNCHSPAGVVQELKVLLGTTEENIRQLRKRARDKVCAYVTNAISGATDGKVKQDA